MLGETRVKHFSIWVREPWGLEPPSLVCQKYKICEIIENNY